MLRTASSRRFDGCVATSSAHGISLLLLVEASRPGVCTPLGERIQDGVDMAGSRRAIIFRKKTNCYLCHEDSCSPKLSNTTHDAGAGQQIKVDNVKEPPGTPYSLSHCHLFTGLAVVLVSTKLDGNIGRIETMICQHLSFHVLCFVQVHLSVGQERQFAVQENQNHFRNSRGCPRNFESRSGHTPRSSQEL